MNLVRFGVFLQKITLKCRHIAHEMIGFMAFAGAIQKKESKNILKACTKYYHFVHEVKDVMQLTICRCYDTIHLVKNATNLIFYWERENVHEEF